MTAKKVTKQKTHKTATNQKTLVVYISNDNRVLVCTLAREQYMLENYFSYLELQGAGLTRFEMHDGVADISSRITLDREESRL